MRGGFREQAATLVSQIDFNPVVLHGMLAFLLFAGSIHVNLDELGREWLTISSLAIFATCTIRKKSSIINDHRFTARDSSHAQYNSQHQRRV